MKRFLAAVTVMLTIGSSIQVFAADVGVSISVGQPGFYGRIDIGNAPPPEYVNPQPIIIQPAPRGIYAQPIYLRVPPGHRKHWRKHCAKYNACGQPVYFVKDRWYTDVYAPHYNKHHDERYDGNQGRGHKKGKHRGHGRD